MLELRGAGITVSGVADLQVVRLGHVVAPGGEVVGELALEGHTAHQVQVVVAELAVIGEVVLHQEVGIGAVALGKALVALGQVVGGTLDEGRNEGEVLAVGLAVGEVQRVVQLVVLVLRTDHVQEIHGGAAGGDDAVHDGVALQQVVVQERVRHADVAMDIVIIGAEAP